MRSWVPSPVSGLVDAPNVASTHCPGCAQGRDPVREILTVCWCDAHRPVCDGAHDERAAVSRDVLASNAEADAATNRPWCEWVHRAVRAHRPARPVTALSRHDDVERGS